MKKINLRKKRLKYPRICMITGPLPDSIVDADIIHISGLLRLLEPLAEKIFVISRNLPENIFSNDKIQIKNIKHRSNSRWMFIRIPKFVIMQLKISYQLFKMGKKIDIVLFSIGAVELVLPMILARLMRKKIILMHPGVGVIKVFAKIAYRKKLSGLCGQIYPRIASILEMFSYSLSDKIIVHSPSLTKFVTKKTIHKKLIYGSRFFVDANSFKIEKDVSARVALIGYIGKFHGLKGIPNFIEAVPLIVSTVDNVKFLICGEGSLRDVIEKKITDVKLDNVVTITSWISHDKLPVYLNEIKLLIIPSYAEVGPQLLFEAMACGTPVLATPVGVIPDVIKDGETGFIMENNSPECIAENVIRALNYHDLDRIAKNARKLIEKEYTYEAAVERYRKALNNI